MQGFRYHKPRKISAFFSRIKNFFSAHAKRKEKEYSKRLLDRIITHSMLMMWASYILAWFGRIDIAEALSQTIATAIITVVVGYLAKSVIENISKHTTAFGTNINDAESVIKEAQERALGYKQNSESTNINRDC